MQIKCNFCEHLIPTRLLGKPTVVCGVCGAKYHKQVSVEVTVAEMPPT